MRNESQYSTCFSVRLINNKENVIDYFCFVNKNMTLYIVTSFVFIVTNQKNKGDHKVVIVINESIDVKVVIFDGLNENISGLNGREIGTDDFIEITNVNIAVVIDSNETINVITVVINVNTIDINENSIVSTIDRQKTRVATVLVKVVIEKRKDEVRNVKEHNT